LVVLNLVQGECPAPDVVTPCTCTNSNQGSVLSCSGPLSSDQIGGVFQTLTKSGDLHDIDGFELSDSDLTELSGDIFGSVTFKQITITNSPKFTTIKADTFAQFADFLQELFLINTNVSNQDLELYKTIIGLTNLTVLGLGQNPRVVAIPDNAYPNEPTKLQSFYAGQNFITTIGSNAYSDLHDIRELVFQMNPIKLIKANAFATNYKSDEYLDIVLDYNHIDASSYEPGALSGIQRPAHLYLSSQIKLGPFPPEAALRPYFEEHKLHDLYYHRSTDGRLQCDCGLYWLYKARADFAYRIRGQSMYCSNDVVLFDLEEDYFANCTTSNMLLQPSYVRHIRNSGHLDAPLVAEPQRPTSPILNPMRHYF